MAARKEEPDRENRIVMEIVVDAYDAEEQRLGWYYYLERSLAFPFVARRRGDASGTEEVEVVGLLPEEDCEDELLVYVREEDDDLSVPLEDLEFVRAAGGAEATRQAMEDWRYWVDRGYSFHEDDEWE